MKYALLVLTEHFEWFCLFHLCRFCQVLGECDPSNLDPACTLTTNSLPNNNNQETALSGSKLNMCTLEGLQGGTALPGISATGALPSSTCDTDADCISADYQCSRKDERPLCACFDGKDSCRKIGGCVITPCKSCNNCIQSLQGFVQDHATATAALTAASFFTLCSTTLGYSIPVCTSIQASILMSMDGNLGKRGGQLCTLLGACSKQLPETCWLTNAAAIDPLFGKLDACTREGITAGTLVAGIEPAGALPTGYCRTAEDCGNPGFTGSKDPAVTKKQCSCSGGEDACEVLGR